MTSNRENSARYARDLIELAQRDEVAFQVLIKSSQVDFSIIGFHAQQAVEKLIKAVLTHHELEFPLTHDLVALHNILVDAQIPNPFQKAEIKRLTPYAETSRYDLERDEILDETQAQAMVALAMTWATKIIFSK